MNKLTARDLIRIYKLEKHPEGGFFRENYRAAGKITGSGLSFSTAIYFLLPAGERSRLHRIKSDELWHFYLGGPMTVAQISPDGRVEPVVLGQDSAAGQKLQHIVPAGYWFGAYPNEGTDFSLVGCTVAPGFEFSDFELAERAVLLKQFPQAKDVIVKLT